MNSRETVGIEERVSSLLASSSNRDHPLHIALAELFDAYKHQQSRMERLVHISDGFQRYSLLERQSLIDSYHRQLKRLDKVARISDRYQRAIQQSNVELRQESLFDPLTGLANRRMLTDRILSASDRARRHREPFAIAMLDVDHFKRINDQHGHEAGDRVLVAIAATLRDQTRSWDLCGRWGGEEFVLLLPNSGVSEAIPVIERLLEAIRRLSIKVKDEVLKITASCGLSEHKEGDSLLQSLNRADAALLDAKRRGRDRYEVELVSD
ncbi:biofilm regulation diguanylate cyclase SiaD [Halotalea alkalilenta]|uniref:biofilm regulation diguanylate cyclase SiaD n=1 Tax=Halotalea alkalilenta TaxID=376489 RepID=UPI000484D012|nr:biofilm regulation diguanylate cyclase SiaD [Halotalea alkalilenta]